MDNKWFQLIVLVTIICRGSADVLKAARFPDDFQFGVATASYQIEGAWNVSDKGESIWDRLSHEHKDRIYDHTTGDVATDSYHLFREDVKLIKRLGVNFYRFSISWPRILPTGFSNIISNDGVRYYNELINELLANNINPLVTMYHWDLPQSLQELGGWTNPMMAEYFLDYAEVLFEKFGDRVTGWITFNEPYSFCEDGYGGFEAPGTNSSGFEDYLCGHNVLRAHGMVYRLYNQKYRQKVNGTIGITICMPWMEGQTTSSLNAAAAERAAQFTFGWFANPIFSKHGDYPKVMREYIDRNSKVQNFSRSRLPTFTAEEVEMIRGSSDFLGLNHYTTYLAKEGNGKVSTTPSFFNDLNVVLTQDSAWPKSNSSWLKVVPWGFRKSLVWIRNHYDNPPVIITENGISTQKGLKDTDRVSYIELYLRSMLSAIHEDGCMVLAYTHWSLLDNFEWLRGYSERFGLYEVDYTSPKRTRTMRNSGSYYAEVIRTRTLP